MKVPATAERRLAAQARVGRALAGHPVRRQVFGWILKHARKRVRDRENLRLERTRLFGRVRRIFVELGRRFRDMDLIDDSRDIFYLDIGEILAFVDGRSTCADLRSLTALRRREFEQYEAGPAPDPRFETRGPLYHGHNLRRSSPSASSPASAERRGIGCSPGVVRGPVRIVSDPRTVDTATRAILVASHTDPGWVLVFPSALGVIVERGSPLSHAAIVARELGIPAVVSVPGAAAWLADGEWVEMDGSTGVIRVVPTPEPAHRAELEIEKVVAHA
jgi:rifampicin phosphotransferase